MTSKRWVGGSDTKAKRLEIRLSAEEKAVCERQAKLVGMTLSDWVRWRMMLERSVKLAPVAEGGC